MRARQHLIRMGAVHKLVWNEERELQEVHLNVTVKAEGQDNEWEERCDVIRWAKCAIGETKNAGLDCHVSRKSASFELQEVATIRSATLWEDDNRGIFSCFFYYLLSFYDLTNYLVSFFFSSSSCNKNTAQTFTQEPNDRDFLEVMFGCESWSVVSDHQNNIQPGSMIRYIRREIFGLDSCLFVIRSQEGRIVIVLVFSAHSEAKHKNDHCSNKSVHCPDYQVSIVTFDGTTTIEIMAECSNLDNDVQYNQKKNSAEKFEWKKCNGARIELPLLPLVDVVSPIGRIFAVSILIDFS